MFHNLKEMLAHYDAETPYQLGRSFYEATDCGPWTAFIVADQPERVERLSVRLRASETGLIASTGDQGEMGRSALMFLGFEDDGTNKLRWKSLPRYAKRVRAFARKQDARGNIGGWLIGGVFSIFNGLRIDLARKIPATTRNVSYESKTANSSRWAKKCIAIEFGSIVEGCDHDVPSEVLIFPFSAEDVDRVLKRINGEASIVWEWANVPKDSLGKRHRYGKTDMERGRDWPLL